MRSSRESGSRHETLHRSPSPATQTSAIVYPLHGAFAVRDTSRGYVVVELQHGYVTAVDHRSVTVTSPDGYTRRYEIRGDEMRTLEASHGVQLTAGCRLTVAVRHGGRPQVLSIEAPTDEELGHVPSRSARPDAVPSPAARGGDPAGWVTMRPG